MIRNVTLSLSDIAGSDYTEHVCRAAAALGIGEYAALRRVTDAPVDFYPETLARRLDELLESESRRIAPEFNRSSPGAGTRAFDAALCRRSAPLSGLGFFRIGEDGCLAVTGKSEHYQASLGHNFPGYRLLRNAAEIGITNITHNNTRGHLTRLLERELVRVANGLTREQTAELDAVVASDAPHVLNRVINLETGSLACEAAFKMMLARFYKLQDHFEAPVHAGKTPVFLVMADLKGGFEANYHGTAIMTQMLRGMWPELYEKMAAAGVFRVAPVPINDADAFARTVEQYDAGRYKVAGFLHELVLMNYGGLRLEEAYVRKCHELCR